MPHTFLQGGTPPPPVLEVSRNVQLGSVNKPWIQTLEVRGPRGKGPGWLKWRAVPPTPHEIMDWAMGAQGHRMAPSSVAPFHLPPSQGMSPGALR